MGMLCHLLGILASFLGPLIIWLLKKDEYEFVDDQGKEALNFQITLIFAYLACIVLTVVSCGFLFFLPLVPAILALVFGIMGTIAANNGERYRYPMNIRLIK